MLLVDSSVLVAHLRGHRESTRFLREHGSRGALLVPALATWELWKGATTALRVERVHTLLEAVTIDPFTPAMARLAGELHIRHREAGTERPAIDLLIAAHALHHRCPVATSDRDYASIQGLQVIQAPPAGGGRRKPHTREGAHD